MDYIKVIILGIVQGLTEFLPVSSSGHLELAKILLGSTSALESQGLLLTLILHAATALSTVVVFRKDIAELLQQMLRGDSEGLRFAGMIVLSMIPAVGVGLFFKDAIEALFNGNLYLVGGMLWVTAFLLFVANRPSSKNKRELSPKNSFLIGLMQAFAILPGVSRSGSTIATAIAMGINRSEAARFSFLMVIPLIFGSMAKSVLDAQSAVVAVPAGLLICGFVSAFITGIIACRWMIALVEKSRLQYFAYYCLIVGTLAISYGVFS